MTNPPLKLVPAPDSPGMDAPPPDRPAQPSTVLRIVLLWSVSWIAAGALIAAVCSPAPTRDTLGVMLDSVARNGWVVLLHLTASFGLGRFFRSLFRNCDAALPLQAATGFAANLWLGHVVLQVVGINNWGRLIPLGIDVVGVMLAYDQGRAWLKASRRARGVAPPRPRPTTVWYTVAVAVIAAFAGLAAVMPPGWLWDSEFGGYDALSYHLQLPQEWLAAGRLVPLAHNVYSFLPSFVEVAYVQFALIEGLATRPDATGRMGLLTGEGGGAITCQLFSAMLLVPLSWILCALARAAITAAGLDLAGSSAATGARRVSPPATRSVGRLVAIVAGATPWLVVTGSLAYNEVPLVLLCAAALLAALAGDIAPLRRAALCAVLLGAACGVKPTALILAGPSVGLALVWRVGLRRALPAGFVGASVGLVLCAPWLIRNWSVSGNPVFPALSTLFGHGHWTPEQATRFAAAHSFGGSVWDRFRLMVLVDPTDPAGARHRGMLHPQWGLFFVAVFLAAADICFWLRKRPVVWVLCAGLALQVAAWMFATHIQSRFLMPLIPIGVCILAIASAAAIQRFTRPALVRAVWATLVLVGVVQLALAARGFAVQRSGTRDGAPLAMLGVPPAFFAGDLPRDAPEAQRDELIRTSPTVFVAARSTTPLTLIGGATAFYYPPGTRYATVWDTPPIDLGDSAGPNVSAVTTAGESRRYYLIDFAELDRLARSGTLSPAWSVERVTRWMTEHTEPVQEFPAQGMILVRAKPAVPSR